jgi:hypothetical protein
MLDHSPVVESAAEKQTIELSAKLQQLRRLRVQPDGQTTSQHLNSALQAAKREPANLKSEVSYVFIGIEIPSSN